MSFYDDASLVFLPSGGAGKDTKAYSIKPTNGDGDFTFSRGSNLAATRVDSNGLIEKGRENLLLQSNQFDTTWGNYLIATPTSGQSGYNGNNDAWLVQCINTSNFAGVSQAVSSSGVNVLSFYAKSGNVDYVGAHINAGTQGNINFELTGSGSVGSVWNTGLFGEIKRVGITDWYRCSFVFNGNLSNVRIGPRSSISSFNSAIGDNVIIQDAQLEQGLVATEYIESGASTGKAGLLENEPRFNYPIGGGSPHLLLEPSRTQLVGNSEYITDGTAITAVNNDAQSPEGLVNATRFRLGVDESATRHRKLFVLSATSGEDYAFSVFFKEADAQWIQLLGNTPNGVFDSEAYVNFDLQNGVKGNVGTSVVDSGIEDYGNGWYRCYIVATAQATATGYLEILTTNNTDSGRYPSYENTTAINYCYVFGAQIEQASYPTSYIPNHSGGSVSRESEEVETADVSSLINQNEGTFFLDFEFLDGQTAENQNWIALESENNQEKVLIYKSASNSALRYYLTAQGSAYISGTALNSTSPNTRYKVAVRYSNGDFAIYVNGTKYRESNVTYTRGSNLSRLRFSESYIQPSCRVRQAIVFTSGFSNDDLEKLTSGI